MKEYFKKSVTQREFVLEFKDKDINNIWFYATFTNYRNKSIKNTIGIRVNISPKRSSIFSFTPFEYIADNIDALSTDIFIYNSMKVISTQFSKDDPVVEAVANIFKSEKDQISEMVKRISVFTKSM